jgi:hypothetical protein
MSKYYLMHNIKSSVNSKIYALKGEVVIVISDHDNCYCVVSENNQTFGVNKCWLSKEFIEKEKTIIEPKIKKNAKRNT